MPKSNRRPFGFASGWVALYKYLDAEQKEPGNKKVSITQNDNILKDIVLP
jgi:hypothetical protein